MYQEKGDYLLLILVAKTIRDFQVNLLNTTPLVPRERGLSTIQWQKKDVVKYCLSFCLKTRATMLIGNEAGRRDLVLQLQDGGLQPVPSILHQLHHQYLETLHIRI